MILQQKKSANIIVKIIMSLFIGIKFIFKKIWVGFSTIMTVIVLNVLYYIGIGFFVAFKIIIFIPLSYVFAFIIRFFRLIIRIIRGAFLRIKKAIMNTKVVKDYLIRYNTKKQVLLMELTNEVEVRGKDKVLFQYEALNSEERLVKGQFKAFSKVDVHSFLLEEGFDVYDIKASSDNAFMKIQQNITDNYKIKYKDLVFILTQLETFLRSGIALVESIRILSKQTKDPRQKTIMMSLIYDISNGYSLSQAMEEQMNAFPRLLVSMIKTAEVTGDLNESLLDMVNYYDSINKTRKQMISALSYPMMVFVFTILVVIFMLVKVVPEFVDMFAQLDTEIPPITEIVVNSSNFMVQFWWVVILVIIAIILTIRQLFKKSKAFRYNMQKTLMHLPVIGNVIIFKETTTFTKTFASLLNHNIMISDSLNILQHVTQNEIFKELIYEGIQNLSRGEDISTAFKNKKLFPNTAYEMLVTGEKTGEPGKMMSRVAEYYQEQHRLSVNQIKIFVEPAIIILLAGIVGLILLAVVLPMLDVYNSVQL